MKLLGRKSSRVKIRPLTSFQDLRGETGRAAESGGTIHIAIGNGGLIGEDAATSLAALEVVQELADTAVLYNAPPIITVGDPTLLPIAQDILRRAYERHGLVKRYNPDHVRFVAPVPVAYAAGAADVVATENVMSNAMIGTFGPEVSLIADAAMRHDLPQLAAAATPDAIGALYPATDRLAMGEELYAAGAQMTEKRRYTISLQAQDILRLILAGFIAMTAILALLAKLVAIGS
jgi:hypothetical protein